jgi:hypothetical protein
MQIIKIGLLIALSSGLLMAGRTGQILSLLGKEIPTVKIWKLQCSGIAG